MRIPDDLLPGDVLLYKRRGKFGWIISFVSNSSIAHVEVYEGDGKSVASRDGKGVNRYPLRLDGLAYVLRPASFDLLSATKWFEAVQGKKYGWIDLANFAMPDLVVDSEGMFCSEFAVGYLRTGGVSIAHKMPAVKVSPRDFRYFDALVEIHPEDARVVAA